MTGPNVVLLVAAVCLVPAAGGLAAVDAALARVSVARTEELVRERVAAGAADAIVIDLSDAICPGDPCQAVVGNLIVQRDDHHLTATFAASLAGRLEAALPIPR